METRQIRELSQSFEIGAHTIDHLALTTLSPDEAESQIVDSKHWIEDVTGKRCQMFCPPLGKFNADHHRMIREAGFVGYRTVEMLSTDRPRDSHGLKVLPTTLQAHPHDRWPLVKNALKRRSIGSLMRSLGHRGGPSWPDNVGPLMNRTVKSGGVFHVWGHSWEIEENGQWQNLDECFRRIRDRQQSENWLAGANEEVCQR